MAKEKAPAFQWYPKDFLSDEKVMRMSYTERGIYITLVSVCWIEGTLPLATDELAELLRLPLPRFTKLWEKSVLRSCFQVQPDGRMHHKRLEEEREKQAMFSRRQSDAAVSRWHKPVNAVALPSHSPREEDRRLKKKTPEDPEDCVDANSADADGGRAALLLEHYRAWYAKYRFGAKLRLMSGPLEFGDALTLVALWDDARLEKLARIVLTTDDEWVAGTDRGWKIFVAKASWADNRLREIEAKAS